MNRNRHDLCVLIVMGVVALGTVFTISFSAADAWAGRELTVTPNRELGPREVAIVKSAGTRLLVHIAEARGAIQEGNATRAREDLREAENLLSIIRSALPTATVKNRIWVARRHLEYEETQQVLPDLVPIDEELILLGDFVPTGEARSRLQKARVFLESGDEQAGRDELKAVDASVGYEEVDIPLSGTQARVSGALGELAIGDIEMAEADLQDAEDSVRTILAVARGSSRESSATAHTQVDEKTEDE